MRQNALKRETRQTWAVFKPSKEVTKKERMERTRNKHKGVQEQ